MPNNFYPSDPSTGIPYRDDVPQDQEYADMSDPSGQMAEEATEDFNKAMLTPGGLLKKVRDSVGHGNPSSSTEVESVPSSRSDDPEEASE